MGQKYNKILQEQKKYKWNKHNICACSVEEKKNIFL